MRCQHCAEQIVGSDRRKKYCGRKCRQSAYRVRRREGHAVPESAGAEIQTLRQQLRELRASRNYYQNKVEDAREKARYWRGETHRLRVYIRYQHHRKWVEPFETIRPSVPPQQLGPLVTGDFEEDLIEDLAEIRAKLGTLHSDLAWKTTGYDNFNDWWAGLLDKAEAALHVKDGIPDSGQDDLYQPEWTVEDIEQLGQMELIEQDLY